MSIELQVTDEDMMDLSVPEDAEGDEELLPVDGPNLSEGRAAEAATGADEKDTKLQMLKRLYGVPLELEPSKKWHGDLRLNVVHVHGVQEMSSDDVLAYFKDFDPASLEWVNDTSCNVVFDDAQAASRAMVELMTHRIQSANAAADVTDSFPSLEAPSLEEAVPDGTWLLGKAHEKSKQLLLRYAQPNDKKKSGGGKFSEYYRKHGNPHYGGKKQLMSGSLAEKLKKMSEMEGELEDDDEALPPARPAATRERSPDSPPRRPLGLRMKMRADDEEEEKGRPRSYDKFQSESEKKSVWDRLEKPSVLDRIGSTSRVIQRKRPNSSESLSVWSRLSLSGSSAPRKDGKERTIFYSNIRIKK